MMVLTITHASIVGGGAGYPARVETLLRRRQRGFQRCITEVVNRYGQRLEGPIVAGFAVDRAGRAQGASTSGFAGYPELGTCVVGVVRSIRFPRPSGGDARVTLTLTARDMPAMDL